MGGRMQREGIVHDGIELQFDGERHRIAFDELTGKSIVIYGQTEVVKDLIEARLESGRPMLFEVGDVSVSDLETDRPRVAFTHEGARQELECDVIAGCDGFHGVCRPSIPDGVLTEFSREYPFGWLGILAAVAPSIEELVYSAHQRGFALLSLRTPELSRYYLQCAPDEDPSAVAGREDLGGAPAAGRARGVDARGGADPREGRHRNAQLCGRADAVRPAVPGRRCGAHRPADGREGAEPGDRRRAAARRDDRRLVPVGRRRCARRATRRMPPPRLARRALLLVDDDDAAPAAGRGSVRLPPAPLPAEVRDRLGGGCDLAGRELRRATEPFLRAPPARPSPRACARGSARLRRRDRPARGDRSVSGPGCGSGRRCSRSSAAW